MDSALLLSAVSRYYKNHDSYVHVYLCKNIDAYFIK